MKNKAKIEILILTMILAMCSIVYELLLANTLSLVSGNYIYWQSMTIGVYLGGLGVGAFLSDRFEQNYKNLIKIEFLLSFLGMISVLYIYLIHGNYKYIDSLFYLSSEFNGVSYLQSLFMLKIIFFIFAQALTFAIGLLSGFEIPILMKVAEKELGDLEKNDYIIFGMNYIGTLFGTILFAYWMLPKLDVIKTSVFVAMLNLVVCLYLVAKYLNKKKVVYLAFCLMMTVFGGFIVSQEKVITQAYLKVFYYIPQVVGDMRVGDGSILTRILKLPEVERYKSLYQYLDILNYNEYKNGVKTPVTVLTLDTNFQFSSDTEHLYHEGFSHVPIALNKSIPRSILVLGGGDGLLLREILKYPEIEDIDFIELDDKMIEFAKEKFSEMNKNSLDDPRVKTQINDGFYYLRNNHKTYDAIFVDFPYPNSYDLARLYSVEFYTFVSRALNTNGFAVLDAPFYEKQNSGTGLGRGRITLRPIYNTNHDLNNNMLASTFYYAGFRTIFPYGIGDETFIFLKKESGQIDFNFMDQAQNLDKFTLEARIEAENIKKQNYPYRISKQYINSIFRPIVVDRN